MNERSLQDLKHSPVLAGIVFLGVLAFIYHQTVLQLFALWFGDNSHSYSHGSLLLLVSCYLLYKKIKDHNLSISNQVSSLLLMLSLGGSLLWFLAGLGQVQIVQYIALVLLVFFALSAVYGSNSFKLFALPVFLLLFALPMWEFFTEVLRWITIRNVGFILNNTGISILVEGMNIHVPSGVFAVEPECSGLGQFIVALAVAVVYVDISGLSLRNSLLVIALAALVAIVSNTVRIYVVVLVGHFTDMQHPMVADHANVGRVIFAIIIFAFFFVLNRYVVQAPEQETSQSSPSPVADTTVSVVGGKSASPARGFLGLSNLLGVLAAVVVGPVLLLLYSVPNSHDMPLAELPEAMQGWDSTYQQGRPWQPRIAAHDYFVAGNYTDAKGDLVELRIYQFFAGEQGREAVNDNNSMADKVNWHLSSASKLSRPIHDLATFNDVEESLINKHNGVEKLVWHWYQIGDSGTSNKSLAKLLGIWGRLSGMNEERLIVVSTDINSDEAQARQRLERFVATWATYGNKWND